MNLPKYTDHFKNKKRMSNKERFTWIVIGFLCGVLLALHFINYIISPKFEVAMPKPLESVGQDGQGAYGTQNAGHSADFKVPGDGASYTQ